MAIPTVEEFKAAFPEFQQAPDALVQAKLDAAAARTSAAVWCELHTQGVMYRTADLLAKTPQGRAMRLVSDKGRSVYWEDLQTMVRRVAAGSHRAT